MLTQSDILAFNELSEPLKNLLWYAVNDFKGSVTDINKHCKLMGTNDNEVTLFHNKLVSVSDNVLQALQDTSLHPSFPSLVTHFAPAK